MLTLLTVGPSAEPPTSWSSLRSPEYTMHSISVREPISEWLNVVQAVILFGEPDQWLSRIPQPKRDVPFIWACDADDVPVSLSPKVDGVLFPTMSSAQAALSIRATVSARQQAYTLERERDELLIKLKERRWVEHAKQILLEIKGLDDDAAYKFLREQAMNERKRLIEVAQSIVKAYQLIRR